MLLTAQGLTKRYEIREGLWAGRTRPRTALRDASFTLKEKEILGVVGESGSGKTTLARILGNLIRPSEGRFYFSDEIRRPARDVQTVFQNPLEALDPRMTLLSSLREPLLVNGCAGLRERIADAVGKVGLPQDVLSRLPSQLSGGQRQKAVIARAIAAQPKLLIADEPTSALDVSLQAQILNLFLDLNEHENLTILFITHNLSIVRILSHRILVLYSGIIVEQGPAQEVCGRPRHPYTRLLMEPLRAKPRWTAPGSDTRPTAQSCPFAGLCGRRRDACTTSLGPLLEISPGHSVRCFNPC